MHKDIRTVREHYAAIRDLISQTDGGRDEPAARVQVALLCGAAIGALDDFECRQRLRIIERHAVELYSVSGHRKWDREHMSGAQYLRLQIFIALEALNTRLFVVEAIRDRFSPRGEDSVSQPPSI